MTQSKSSTTWRWVAMLLGIAALILCTVMVRHSLTGAAMIGCNAGSSCDTVLSSRWSVILGVIPVSALALGVYLAMLICLYFLKDRELAPLIRKILLVLAGAIIGSAIWFFILQKWMIGSYCKYCMATHITGILLSCILIWRVCKEQPDKLNPLLAAVGLLLAAGMAGVQLLTTPRYAYDAGAVEETLPLIGVDDAPVLGEPGAANIVDLMFDYQCSHCRKIHFMAKEIVERYPGQIAFVLCPTPLSYACNPYVAAGTRDQFAGSCDLARLSLAVYRSKPEAYAEFDEWLFTPEDAAKGWYPRTVQSATAKAVSLIGEDAVRLGAEDAWATGLLSKDFELFGRTSRSGKGGIPRLVAGNKWVIPEADDTAGLIEILQTEFGIELIP